MNRHSFRITDTDIYCITARQFSLGRSNREVVKQILDAGIKLVQYREKDFTMLQKYRECVIIRDLTANYGACFIVMTTSISRWRSRPMVSISVRMTCPSKKPEIAGDKIIIGLSSHAPAQAKQAVELGADYIGAGPLFQTLTKKDVVPPVGLRYLDYVVQNHLIPFVAIGGVKQNNVAEVVKHGARCVALVTEIVGAKDIGEKIRAIRAEMLKARQGANT